MPDWLTLGEFSSLFQVILIDVALAGDNAIVVGMAAAGLPPERRQRAIILGIGAATVLRIAFALFTTQLLQIVGLLFAGGLLLLWVSWKLWREIRSQGRTKQQGAENGQGEAAGSTQPKTFRQAITQIVLADVSMSLDNVLAVAGAAREHTWVLIVGLALSVALMGLAASFVARLLTRYHWIAYIGLLVILYVALAMMYDGAGEVIHALDAPQAMLMR